MPFVIFYENDLIEKSDSAMVSKARTNTRR
jgi:hypothetical protein